jgi:tetratricopeptide (TPR) repeat protein
MFPATFAGVSPRARVISVVAAAAAVAVGGVVGYAAHTGGEPVAARSTLQPRAGAPPLALDLGVRSDPEARDLRRALGLYDAGKRRQAGGLFARYSSLEARVGQAFAAWPSGSLVRVTQLATANPRSGVVQVNLGLARFWAGKPGAVDAWRRTVRVAPDTAYAVTAGNLLFPRYNRNLPAFVPAEPPPAGLAGKSPAAQLDFLRRRAAAGSATAKLLYGVALQNVFRPISARREFDAAARLAPNNPEAQTAAAVGRFDKANLSAAFSRLGPLTRRFPQAATVRFHLGLLLLWTGALAAAETQLRQATTVEPVSPLALEAQRFLATMQKATAK